MRCLAVCSPVLALVLVSTAFLATTAQGQDSFQTEFPIAATSLGVNQSNPSLAISSSGIIYVAWDENIDGNTEIFLSRSLDSGDNFGSPIRLTDSAGQANYSNPVLALDSTGTLLVAWEHQTDGDTDILVAKSQDPWGSFTSPAEASDGPDDTEQILPDLVVDSGGTVHVAWEDLRDDRDIRVSTATVSALTFGGSVEVNDDAGSSWQQEPSIAVDGQDNVYIAWYDRRDTDPYAYLAKSTNGGQSYGSNVKVSGSTVAPQFEPEITIVGGKIHCVWQDGRTGITRDIYFASAPSDTLAFGSSVKVNSGVTNTNQRAPALYVEQDGTIHVVWQDFRDSVFDVYYGVSTNGGTSFRDEKVNEAPGNSILEKANPRVTVDADGIIYVVWEDTEWDDAKIMMAISGNGGNGNGNGNGLISMDLLMWIIIAVVAVVIVIVLVALVRRRRSGKEEE